MLPIDQRGGKSCRSKTAKAMSNIQSLPDMLFSPEPQNWLLLRTMYRRKLPIKLTDLAWKRLVEEHAQYLFRSRTAEQVLRDAAQAHQSGMLTKLVYDPDKHLSSPQGIRIILRRLQQLKLLCVKADGTHAIQPKGLDVLLLLDHLRKLGDKHGA